MKRIVSILAILGLILGAVTVAEAAKKKKKKKAKAVQSTLYFHGTEVVGDVDTVNNIGTAYLKMDTNKPTAAEPKSKSFGTWEGYPWNDCAGMYTVPVWQGAVSGQVVGDLKVSINAVSPPTDVLVQVWPDLMSQQCASNDLSAGEYPQPVAEAVATFNPAGETEVTLKNKKFKAIGAVTIQIRAVGPNPGRILYDATDFASSLSFKCIPASGKSCT